MSFSEHPEDAAFNRLRDHLVTTANTLKVKGEYVVPNGMALSIWEDKYSRRKADGTFQTWGERLREVVVGNFLLDQNVKYTEADLEDTLRLAINGVMPFSGRHLQHGDVNQPNKNLEGFTNCSTAAFSFSTFWLLLNGSGVGSDYSIYTRTTDYSKYMPHLRFILDGGSVDDGKVENGSHPDFIAAIDEFSGGFDTKRDALHKYPRTHRDVRWIEIEDSREGWVKAMEAIETATWEKSHADDLFILDFSKLRAAGTPIVGQQGRPASGPIPLMRAFAKVASLRGVPGIAPWKQAMFVDHYLATSVVLGGIRRAARMATKYWNDPDIFEFINIKQGGFLWSANISVVVNQAFWDGVQNDPTSHAHQVFEAITRAQFEHQTGEPGFLTTDRMVCDMTGIETITAENYINPNSKLKVDHNTLRMMQDYLSRVKHLPNPFIVNPCGEIVLSLFGGYCCIGDICLANAKTKQDAIRAAELMGPALIRVNTMSALYKAEVERTNRIGVSLTGIHEFAAKHWGLSFYDLVNVTNDVSTPKRVTKARKKQAKAQEFWDFIALLRDKVEASSNIYSDSLQLNHPHTYTTVKPSGTISKIMSCTEGAHLPALDYYMRWVQFTKMIGTEPNPVLAEFEAKGYPMKDISHMYNNAVVVGFPTKQTIADLLGDEVVCAEDTDPAEQFEWLRLLERYWFGFNDDGSPRNAQISYTLRFSPNDFNYADFETMLRTNQPTVRCCAIMPISDLSAYAYTPEQKITRDEYYGWMLKIESLKHEAYDAATLDCASGACGLDPNIN